MLATRAGCDKGRGSRAWCTNDGGDMTRPLAVVNAAVEWSVRVNKFVSAMGLQGHSNSDVPVACILALKSSSPPTFIAILLKDNRSLLHTFPTSQIALLLPTVTLGFLRHGTGSARPIMT